MSIARTRKDPKAVLPDDSSFQPWGRHAHAVRARHFQDIIGVDGGLFGRLHGPQTRLGRTMASDPTIPTPLSKWMIEVRNRSEPTQIAISSTGRYPRRALFCI